MRFTVRSTRLIKYLQSRAAAYRGSRIGAKLVVPDSVRFWYWLEFGTALRAEPGRGSGETYPIDPINTSVLSWPRPDGGREYRFHVDHPGIHPRAFVRLVLPSIKEVIGSAVARLMVRGAPGVVQQFLLESGMPWAAEQIVASLASAAPGVRHDEWAKLQGRSASEVLADNIRVEPS